MSMNDKYYKKLTVEMLEKGMENKELKQFYDNWYFYQTYKNKPHYYNPFKIQYN